MYLTTRLVISLLVLLILAGSPVTHVLSMVLCAMVVPLSCLGALQHTLTVVSLHHKCAHVITDAGLIIELSLSKPHHSMFSTVFTCVGLSASSSFCGKPLPENELMGMSGSMRMLHTCMHSDTSSTALALSI